MEGWSGWNKVVIVTVWVLKMGFGVSVSRGTWELN